MLYIFSWPPHIGWLYVLPIGASADPLLLSPAVGRHSAQNSGGGALNLNAGGSKNLMASENRSAQNLDGSVAVGEVTQNLMVVGLTAWNLKISRGGQQLVLVVASEKSEEAVVVAVVG